MLHGMRWTGGRLGQSDGEYNRINDIAESTHCERCRQHWDVKGVQQESDNDKHTGSSGQPTADVNLHPDLHASSGMFVRPLPIILAFGGC